MVWQNQFKFLSKLSIPTDNSPQWTSCARGPATRIKRVAAGGKGEAQDQTLACLILEFGAAKLLLQIVTIIGAVAHSWEILMPEKPGALCA